MAAFSSRLSPPSEKESGVTLRMPMIRGRASEISWAPQCQVAKFSRSMTSPLGPTRYSSIVPGARGNEDGFDHRRPDPSGSPPAPQKSNAAAMSQAQTRSAPESAGVGSRLTITRSEPWK